MLLSKSLLVFFLLIATINSFELILDERTEKCITEEIELDSLVTGFFKLVKPKNKHVDLIVFEPTKRIIFRKNRFDAGKFAFRSEVNGDYRFCFYSRKIQIAQAHEQRVEFKIQQGSDAFDYSNMATVEHLNPLETEIRKTEDIIEEIFEEILYSKGREEAMRNINGKISNFFFI
ncbi:transmembrane emp24 domain-containing protein [Anaeramoeba flamelloides]|uniref:Transmembrane emp24 domain-containing protein n=1 Tax=Anaeramoeba flamelloides TaxID=1746091 RepID=A0AAV7Z738_9EUKA|nr:transmembrane emp24 domain-containing protein [Anaeramoeba flamelloides]